MSESFPSVVTFPNRERDYAKNAGTFHAADLRTLLHDSCDALADVKRPISEIRWGIWTASGEHEDCPIQYPQWQDLLQHTISDFVSEIAQVIEHHLFGGDQPPHGESTYIASVIVQRFAVGDDVATIAHTLWNSFPDTFRDRSATNLVENAIKAIQTVRPGWTRQVLVPDKEPLSFLDNDIPASDTPVAEEICEEVETPLEPELPVEVEMSIEPETEYFEIEASPDSSAASAIPHIPLSELFPNSDRTSPEATTVHRPPVDMYRVGSETSTEDSQTSSEPARVTRAKSAARLFEHPNLRRFAPTTCDP